MNPGKNADSLPIRSQRSLTLQTLLESKVLVLDGAMGTALQGVNLSAEDFGGTDAEGCNEALCLTKPDLIRSIHEKYLEAGADIVETNTFGGTPLVLGEFGLEKKAREINKAAARLAREACAKFETKAGPRFVAGSIGPTTKAISVTGGITFDELIDHFAEQARGLIEGGADYLLLETCQDTRNVKAGLLGIDRVFLEKGERIPIAVSGTIEPMGTMLAGQTAEALSISLSHRNLLYLGLNCATGPEFMTDSIRTLSETSPFPIACVPNAGLPDDCGKYLETPEMLSNVVSRFLGQGWLNLIGGCCGTHAGHIRALKEKASLFKPRDYRKPRAAKSLLSGVDPLEITEEMRPVLVGERTNVIGSKKFRGLIESGKFDEAAEVAKHQVKAGAQIVDICLANPDRNEFDDMKAFLEKASKMIRAPWMIDSTDDVVIELALKYSQGKAIINSINLEDGEERFEKVLPLAKAYGAAVVVGTIDDDPIQGMGITKERKLAIAKRSYALLVDKYGVKPEDIYWDPLVFPCGTGDEQYRGSAKETIAGIALIKKEFPGTKTVLGISNVSFGLPAAGREVLNSVFLNHCVQAGLDLAIVNSEKIERFTSIPEEEKKVAEDLLFDRGEDPIAVFAAAFREKKPKAVSHDSLPLDERLSRAIVEGMKDGLFANLTEALKDSKPLDIINGPLMRGMDEVGRLFNANQLIVAEVLQSAEVMKAAVSFLEPFMEKSAQSSRGKMILATVKGDVHDIGKNLVEIILSNNGFQIINLGIRVPPEKLIEAAREHSPDLIGLSGLLVKSAQMMVLTAEDLSKAGVHAPILVGGAALSQSFTDRQISPAYVNGFVEYAEDAMHGLELSKRLVSKTERVTLMNEVGVRREERKANTPKDATRVKNSIDAQKSVIRSSEVPELSTLPSPPDFEKHVLKTTSIEQIWNWINPLMLYGRHLGVKGGSAKLLGRIHQDPGARIKLAEDDPKALKIWEEVERFKECYKKSEWMKPQAVYRFLKADRDGNSIRFTESAESFSFFRQPRENGVCLSDYVSENDSIALFITTVGKGVREGAKMLMAEGRYLESHILQALAIESAEGFAELLHSELRNAWGFPDPIGITMMERFQAKYRGKRYSFGYPACPRLEDQSLLFKLLDPKEIGVELTEGYMMDPEASVSAIVFHHPNAVYFSVGATGEGLQNDNRES